MSSSSPTRRRACNADSSAKSRRRSRYIRNARSRVSWSYFLGAGTAQSPCEIRASATPRAIHTEEEDAAVDDAEGVIDRSHSAWGELVRGNPQPCLQLFSQRDDVALGNPFGPFVSGWEQVSETVARAATLYRDGEALGFERVATYAAGELVCVVEVERYRAKA